METRKEKEVKFELGELFVTPGAMKVLCPMEVSVALDRHARGDWGEVSEDDWQDNDVSLREGFRLLSAYRSANNTKYWVITEDDRSATTVLLPEEY